MRSNFVFAITMMLTLGTAAGTERDYGADLEAFLAHVDDHYPFFDMKGIRGAWGDTKTRLQEAVVDCASDEAFLGIVREAMGALRDAHTGFVASRVDPPPWPARFFPNLGFMPASENRVCIWWADMERYPDLKPGTLITRVNGQPARSYLDGRGDSLWAGGFFSSPQRARMYAYRVPLQGDRGTEHHIAYQLDGVAHERVLVCDTEARGWAHTYNLPEGLTRTGSTCYTALSGEVGYVYLRRMDGSVVEGLMKAKLAHPKCGAWVFDLRGNGGGGYDDAVIRMLNNWPGPVAGIIDAGCMSAGETFARDLRATAGATLFGTPTAGSSSSKYTWTFPSGIATVRLPSRSRWRADGEPIEYNGIAPDIEVEPDPADVAAGRNTAIERARAFLEEALAAAEP